MVHPSHPLGLLLDRRSTAALTDPAPDSEQLEAILQAATCVPDHGNLRPWRFVVVSGSARERFAAALVADGREVAGSQTTRDSAAATEKLRGKAYVAPMFIVVIASPVDSAKVPEWEQVASASCTGYAITLAAHALGFGAGWKSIPFGPGTALRGLLGMTPRELLLGWINLGRPVHASLPPRPELDVSSLVTHLR